MHLKFFIALQCSTFPQCDIVQYLVVTFPGRWRW